MFVYDNQLHSLQKQPSLKLKTWNEQLFIPPSLVFAFLVSLYQKVPHNKLKYKIRLKLLARDKHSSLLHKMIYYTKESYDSNPRYDKELT